MANSAYDSPDVIAKWHEFRRQHVMASDTPNLCGVGYRDALSVYCDKVDPQHDEPTPEMLAGLLIEPAIARWFELETGLQTRELPYAAATDFGAPWIGATADRESSDGELVEIKKVSAHNAGKWGEPGTSEVPESVQIQAQQQMIVYGRAKVYVPVMIGECDFRLYVVRRDESLIDPLVTITRDFWQRVENRWPPEPDWSRPSTQKLIGRLYKPFVGKEISLGEEYAELAREYLEWGDDVHMAESHRDTIKAKLTHAMQDAERAHVGGYTIDRKEVIVNEKPREARTRSYVRFTVKQPKALPVS